MVFQQTSWKKPIFHCQNVWSDHDPAGQFWLLESAPSILTPFPPLSHGIVTYSHCSCLLLSLSLLPIVSYHPQPTPPFVPWYPTPYVNVVLYLWHCWVLCLKFFQERSSCKDIIEQNYNFPLHYFIACRKAGDSLWMSAIPSLKTEIKILLNG